MPRIKRPLTAAIFACVLFVMGLSPVAQADSFNQPAVTEPSEFAILGDVLVARPFSIAMTVGGAALYVVTLPFSLLGGNAGEMADIMVKRPAYSAFLRCLGCTPAEAKSRRISEDVESD